jgi:AraC-like DNA-binding protein
MMVPSTPLLWTSFADEFSPPAVCSRPRPQDLRPARCRSDPNDSRWALDPLIVEGWRELVTFESSGAMIFGDFTLNRSVTVRMKARDLFFMQILLDGHEIAPNVNYPGKSVGSHTIFGLLREQDDQMNFVVPAGARWKSLFIAVSEGAVNHLWGMGSEQLATLLAKACNIAPDAPRIFAYGGQRTTSETVKLGQIFNCTLQPPLRKACLWSKSLEILIDVVSGLLFKDTADSFPSSRTTSAVVAAKEIMHCELSHPHTIDSLAFRVGLSRQNFITSFKECFGVTFHDYYMHLRMSEAAALLVDGRHRVSAVAQRVGYSQLSSFSRAFKTFHGYSPGQLLETSRC